MQTLGIIEYFEVEGDDDEAARKELEVVRKWEHVCRENQRGAKKIVRWTNDGGAKKRGEAGKKRFYPFPEMAVCISTATLKWRLKEIFELDYLSEKMRWKWTGRILETFASGIYFWKWGALRLLDQYSLPGASFYSRSIPYQSTALLEPGKAHFESDVCSTSLETEGTKEKGLKKLSSDGVLKAPFRQLSSNTCSVLNWTRSDAWL